MTDQRLVDALERIAAALERRAPPPASAADLGAADAFVWHADMGRLAPVPRVNRVDIGLLRGVDRQRDIPIMRIWPVTDTGSMFAQFIIWRQRYIMDVGTMTETLDIPQRWYEAVVWQLSWRLAQELPELDPGLLASIKGTADEALRLAQDEERDNSPIYFAANISPYTR